jgi:hypothetical protein
MSDVCEEKYELHALPCLIDCQDGIFARNGFYFRPTFENLELDDLKLIRSSFRGRAIYGCTIEKYDLDRFGTTAKIFCDNEQIDLDKLILWELSRMAAENSAKNFMKIIAFTAVCNTAFQ